jgi:Na+/melibiose symporter-like transporter
MAGSIVGPGLAAISLGLVGCDALSERLGRNQRFASIGGLTAAGITGVVGYFISIGDIFLLTAACGIPVIAALVRIHAADIHFARACCAPDNHATDPQRVTRGVLFKDHRLFIFAVCLFLFQLANASILPLAGERLLEAEGRTSSLVMSALIIVPQLVVASLAPWVGRTANSWGRRPLLLIGLCVVPVRAASFASTADPTLLVAVQALDGLSGATLGVLTAVVISDLTKGSGRFNLAQGLVGTFSGIGAALSTSISGLFVERFGHTAGFMSVTAVGLFAIAILWAFMPETKAPALQPTPAAR